MKKQLTTVFTALLLAVSAHAQPAKIFVCTLGEIMPSQPGKLVVMNGDGTNVTTLRTASGSQSFRGCHWDASQNRLFVTEGTIIKKLKSDNTSVLDMQSSFGAAITSNPQLSRMYWTELGGPGSEISYSSSTIPDDTIQQIASFSDYNLYGKVGNLKTSSKLMTY